MWTVYRCHTQAIDLPWEWLECTILDVVNNPPQIPAGVKPTSSILLNSRGHHFIPISPDNRHLGVAAKTSYDVIELVLGPWDLEEIKVASTYIHGVL